jgi:hypothetical protein
MVIYIIYIFSFLAIENFWIDLELFLSKIL